jgi:hypothetical protein
VQKPQLHDDEKPEKAFGPDGSAEVLQYVPETYRAQRSEIVSHELQARDSGE